MDWLRVHVCANTFAHMWSVHTQSQEPINVEKATKPRVSFNIPQQCACFGLYTSRDGHMLAECWLSHPFTIPEWREWEFFSEKNLWSRQKGGKQSYKSKVQGFSSCQYLQLVLAKNFPGRLKGSRNSHDPLESKRFYKALLSFRPSPDQGLGRS